MTRPDIPLYSGTDKCNTSQGLYDAISTLAVNGNSNAHTNGKAYAGNSHGPCN